MAECKRSICRSQSQTAVCGTPGVLKFAAWSLADTPECLAEVSASADEGYLEIMFVDMVFLIGRRQHLRLVDEIDFE